MVPKLFVEPIYLGILRAGLPCRFKAEVHKVSNSGRMALKYQISSTGFPIGHTYQRGKRAFHPLMLISPHTAAVIYK